MSTDREIDVLAKTLFGEARGEGWEGLIAVAWVIRNRAEHPNWWGRSIETVCLKPKQFSCWNPGDPNHPYLAGLKAIPGREYVRMREVAVAVLESREPDPTGGATHYYVAKMKNPPAWRKSGTRTAQIGAHVFFKDVG